MSEPIRYDFEQAELNKSAGFYVRKDGHWVKWEDYAKLQSDLDYVRKMRTQETLDLQEMADWNDAMRAEVEELTHDANEADQQYEHAISRVRRLEAEVERLRKAGDALYESEIGYYGEQILVDPKHHSGELCRNWNAAKEGKPSV